MEGCVWRERPDPVTQSNFPVGLAQVVSGPRFSSEEVVESCIGEWESFALFRLLRSKLESGKVGFSLLAFISDNLREGRLLSREEWEQVMRRMGIALVSLLRYLDGDVGQN